MVAKCMHVQRKTLNWEGTRKVHGWRQNCELHPESVRAAYREGNGEWWEVQVAGREDWWDERDSFRDNAPEL